MDQNTRKPEKQLYNLPNKELEAKTDEEWETAIVNLEQTGQWQEMWRLAQIAPPLWSVRLLQRLKKTAWSPKDKDEQHGFRTLVRYAQRCGQEVPGELNGLTDCYATLQGYTGSIKIAISPDSQVLVNAGRGERTIRLWRLPDGALLKTLEGHTGSIRLLSISSDSQLLVSAGRGDSTIRLWRLPDGALLKTLKGHTGNIECLAISPDSQVLVSVGDWEDKTVRLWRLSDGALLKTLQGYMRNVAISPDSQVLISVGQQDNMIRLWQLPDGTLLKTLKEEIGILTISPNSQILAGAGDGIRLWRLPDGKPLKTLKGHTGDIGCLAISPDSQILVSAGWGDNTIRLWQLSDGTLLKTLKGHTESVINLAISPDSQILVSVGWVDNTIRLWRLSDGKLLKVLKRHIHYGSCIAISPDGRILAGNSDERSAISRDSTVRLWRLPDGEPLKKLEGHEEPVTCLAISSDGHLLASRSRDSTVRLWGSALIRLSRLPVNRIRIADIAWAQEQLQKKNTSAAERKWLEFFLKLMYWQGVLTVKQANTVSNPDLTALFIERRWSRSAPIKTQILLALHARHVELVQKVEEEIVEPLLQICEEAPSYIAVRAQSAIRHLSNTKAQEAVWQWVTERDHPVAIDIVFTAQYVPRDPHQQALLYFMTEQWNKYEQLDFDRNLLTSLYEIAGKNLRRKIAEHARRTGRIEWVQIAAGERQGRRLKQMAIEEWEAVLSLLSTHKRWEEMWRLAQAAPAIWSTRLLQRLKEAKWYPHGEDTQAGFLELTRLAEICQETPIEPGQPENSCIMLTGHRGGIRCVAVSPDGRLLASGSDDGTVRLWRMLDGKGVCTLKGHSNRIYRVAFSPDGRLLASGSWDGTVRVWQLSDGTALHTLDAGETASLAFSPDGNLLISGGENVPLRLWSLPGATLLHTLTKSGDFRDGVTCLAVSPDGQLLASGHQDNRVRVWQLPDGTLLYTLEGHTGRVCALAFSADRHLLISGSWDSALRIWQLYDGTLSGTLEGHARRIRCLAISPDGQFLASGSEDGTLRLWTLPDGTPLKTLTGHTGGIECVAISPDGQSVASGGYDHTVRLWQIPDGAILEQLTGHTGVISCMTFSSDGQVLVSGDYDYSVQLWGSGLLSLIYTPIEQMHPDDIILLENAFQEQKILDEKQHRWLTFTLALMCWYRRHDIETGEISKRIPVGEFDIELGHVSETPVVERSESPGVSHEEIHTR